MRRKEPLLVIGRNIEILRKEKKIKQFQLAAICDLEKANLSRIESGETNTTILTLLKISRGLDVPLGELFKEQS